MKTLALALLALGSTSIAGGCTSPQQSDDGAEVVRSEALSSDSLRDVAGRSGCSTQGAEILSQQLIDQMLCFTADKVTRIEHANITLQSDRVHPYVSPNAANALYGVASSRAVTINSAYRTIADQFLLNASCRVAAQPGRSNHETGRAIDVQYSSALNSALVRAGFLHPFPRNDRVHYEFGGTDLRAYSTLAFQRLWNANHPGELLVEDGIPSVLVLERLARAPAEGFGVVPACLECVPTDENEVCGNGLDDDCDGFADRGCSDDEARYDSIDVVEEDLSSLGDEGGGCNVAPSPTNFAPYAACHILFALFLRRRRGA
jgi:hypothetical protein